MSIYLEIIDQRNICGMYSGPDEGGGVGHVPARQAGSGVAGALKKPKVRSKTPKKNGWD